MDFVSARLQPSLSDTLVSTVQLYRICTSLNLWGYSGKCDRKTPGYIPDYVRKDVSTFLIFGMVALGLFVVAYFLVLLSMKTLDRFWLRIMRTILLFTSSVLAFTETCLICAWSAKDVSIGNPIRWLQGGLAIVIVIFTVLESWRAQLLLRCLRGLFKHVRTRIYPQPQGTGSTARLIRDSASGRSHISGSLSGRTSPHGSERPPGISSSPSRSALPPSRPGSLKRGRTDSNAIGRRTNAPSSPVRVINPSSSSKSSSSSIKSGSRRPPSSGKASAPIIHPGEAVTCFSRSSSSSDKNRSGRPQSLGKIIQPKIGGEASTSGSEPPPKGSIFEGLPSNPLFDQLKRDAERRRKKALREGQTSVEASPAIAASSGAREEALSPEQKEQKILDLQKEARDRLAKLDLEKVVKPVIDNIKGNIKEGEQSVPRVAAKLRARELGGQTVFEERQLTQSLIAGAAYPQEVGEASTSRRIEEVEEEQPERSSNDDSASEEDDADSRKGHTPPSA